MKVLKFGGTSVGSVENIRTILDIAKSDLDKGEKIAITLSAMGGVTNQLIEMANMAKNNNKAYSSILAEIEKRHFDTAKALLDVKYQSKVIATIKLTLNELEDILHGISLLKELSRRTLDLVMSFGERLSNYMVSEIMKQAGLDCEFLDARTLIKTDDNFGFARVNFKVTNVNIEEYFKTHTKTQIITGFIGSTEQNETTTLGRGGSDYTAAIFGAALGAKDVEIWTDVDGMMTADPRKVKNAFTITKLSYVEAMELSHFGAKVIYPPTIQPAISKNIPIWVKNTFNPSHPGTLISKQTERGGFPVKGLSSINEIALLNVQGSGMVGEKGVAGRLFNTLAKHSINIILITQASSEHSICFAIDPKDAEQAKSILDEEFFIELHNKKLDKIMIEKELSVIAIVGENMKHTPGISGKMFSALGRNGVNVVAIAQGSSEYNLSVVVPKPDLSKAMNALHDSFFLSETKTMNLFVIGTGLIGKTLMRQISQQAAYLEEKKSLKVNLVGLANTKKMLFNENGISIDHWEKELDQTGETSNVEAFVKTMKAMNLPNCVFVDNTASKDMPSVYEEILLSSISVVTPNKTANSCSYKDYLKLQNAARKRGVNFLYETNVGAGLPIINTLKDLLLSGDRIIRIEAVLSGTLSYIFNNFKSGVKFKDVVWEAKQKGYTEPDPRDDLSGLDVARKILILSRETGLNLEMGDIKIEQILPESAVKAKTIDEFFVALDKENTFFEQKLQKAEKEGKVLRFIAKLENGKAAISLQSVDANHPFYSLSGSDNIISFTTERYTERQLVVKGPGAGAEVTAAGVFADIINISNTWA
jgi:bifunctional aspartokinase / homoserine dehydrogenase 1